MKRFTSVVVILAFLITSIPQQAFAVRAMADDQYQSRISEYFYSPTGKETLIPVNILGEIERPGLYHIPPETNLTTLIAIAGGTRSDANVKKVRLFREGETEKINLDTIIEEKPDFGLRQKDTLYIPRKPELVSQSTLTVILAISAIATTILTSYWIRNETRRNTNNQ
jgi:hypothetical protein